MSVSRSEARRGVRSRIDKVTGPPSTQPTKIGRFAAWVVLFRDRFPEPYVQLHEQLADKKVESFYQLERRLHEGINTITGTKALVRRDPDAFNLWAGGLTAAVHTTSIVRSVPAAQERFGLELDTVDTAVAMSPLLGTLVMEHQDRLGDIKIGLSPVTEKGEPGLGSYAIDPALMERLRTGKIRFTPGSLDLFPILAARKVQPEGEGGGFVPNSGETIVGDIIPHEETIGCPISFMNGFSEALIRAAAETAVANELLPR